MRCLSLALAALLVVAASAVSVPAVDREVTEQDVVGVFKIQSLLIDCPARIRHSATVDLATQPSTLSHSNIVQNGVRCEEGETTFYNSAEPVLNEIDDEQITRTIEAFAESGETVLYAIETGGRTCGETSLSAGTVIFFVTPEETLSLSNGRAYPGGRRYMIISDPELPTLCEYSVDMRDTSEGAGEGATEPVPSATPSETDEEGEGSGGSTGGVVAPGRPRPGGGQGGNQGGNQGGGSEPTEDGATSTEDGTGGAVPTDEGATPTEDGTGGAGGAGPTDEGASPTDDGTFPGVDAEVTESPESSPEDDDSVCFPADAVVEIEGGASKKIADVQIGDRVKVADGEFSDVYMFTHKEASTVHDFVTLSTSSGSSLSATRGHYIYINGGFAAAGSAKVGDVVELGNGARTTIDRISSEKKVGLYNPQTVHGDIIVNSIRASTFTRTIEPQTAQALLAPFRMVYDFVGLSASFLNNGGDQVASMLPKGQVAL